jgi:hypothetical protein
VLPGRHSRFGNLDRRSNDPPGGNRMAQSPDAQSPEAQSHNARMTSWVTVVLAILGFVAVGVALPMESIVLGIVGGILLLAALVMGVAFRIMDDYY